MHNYLESRIALYGRRIIRKRGGMENPSVWLKILPSSAQGRERKRKTSRIWSKLFGSTMECGVIESAATLEGRLRRRWFHIRLMTVLIESRIWYLEKYSTDKTVIKIDVGKIDTIIPIPQTLMDRIRKICEYIVGYFIFILSYTKLKLLESRLLLAKTTLPFFFSTFQQLYSAKIRTVRVQSDEERGNEWHENSDGIRLKEISPKNTIFLQSYRFTIGECMRRDIWIRRANLQSASIRLTFDSTVPLISSFPSSCTLRHFDFCAISRERNEVF